MAPSPYLPFAFLCRKNKRGDDTCGEYDQHHNERSQRRNIKTVVHQMIRRRQRQLGSDEKEQNDDRFFEVDEIPFQRF